MTTPTLPGPPRNTIKTRFLILSDTHAALPTQDSHDAYTPFRTPLPCADVLLHCGDLTMLGHLSEYNRTLALLESIDAPLKLVIPGNHDISLDAPFYARRGREMQGGDWDEEAPRKAKELWTGERARKAGVVYLEEGAWEGVLENGARLGVWGSAYQPEFCDFAFAYQRHHDRYNPPHQCSPSATPIAENPVPDWLEKNGVDVVMTHGPPMGFLDMVQNGDHVGCEHLLRAMRRCKPRLHCFGHIHEGWGAQKVVWAQGGDLNVKTAMEHVESVKGVEVNEQRMRDQRAVHVDASRGGEFEVVHGIETLMVNASIMDVRYRPVQGPWLVDLDLERADWAKVGT
ncbi:ser thr protein phosphatase family protein [Stagonosporopsis vannaccii]|nr:ser thr protein phosphatase family protein [Stagonosporopsis vannaccii]